MLDSSRTLRHLPFFDVLATVPEDGAEWRAATAGVLVLRLVDSWLDTGTADIARDEWSLSNVREAIEAIDSPANLRPILRGVVDLIGAGRPGLRLVGPRLMAYGQMLEYDSQWKLAADVYASIVAHAHPVDEADLATQAHLRIGFCLRQDGRLTESVHAYQTAGDIAAQANDLVGVLRARIGEAKAAMARGNLPQANAILEETIARAREGLVTDVQSMALHDRSISAYLSGDFELAVRLGYEALEISRSPRERDRILGDVATAFRKLGLRSAAHDAYVILAATAQELYGRWSATLNLMEMASEDGQQVVFEQYRRSLSPEQLPVQLQVSYWHISAMGQDAWGTPDESRAYLERALAVAEEHDLNQAAFELREALASLGREHRGRNRMVPPPLLSDATEEVARRVRSARLDLEV